MWKQLVHKLKGDPMTEDEIKDIVNESSEQGILEEEEAEMIGRVMELDTKDAGDIMTPRTKVVGIDAETPIEEALRFMLGQAFSRYPLYEEDIDHVTGILHLKDLTRCVIYDEDETKTLQDIARKPYFVPESMDIDDLFRQMQAMHSHMAVVVDEYGQTVGVVSMEDILEEIVGNIFDEYDVEDREIVRQSEGRFLINGLADLQEVGEALGIEVPEDYETLNGLLISMLGRIPAEGEKPVMELNGWTFHVLDVRENRIRLVRAVKDSRE